MSPSAAATAGPGGAPTVGAADDPHRIGMEWTEKYRPQHLKDVVGNNKAVLTMKKWAESWQEGAVPEVRALVLQGTAGIGKTSSAHALARDMGWDVIELNASDSRSATAIQRVAGTGSQNTSFAADGSFRPASEGGRTLIILDEADNLYERGGAAATSGGEDLSDRGGKRAIIDTIRATRQPIVLIVNDYYGLTKGSGAALRSLSEAVKFQRPQTRSVAKRLADICRNEGIQAHPDALMRIADEAGGDMRGAVNDLQAVAQGRTTLRPEDVGEVGTRDTGKSVFDAMPQIFKTMDADKARRATYDLDENPEHIILWVEENLPLEYKQPDDLDRGFDRLSKADVYLGRVRRRQYYGLWSYASEMMTAGVAMAKKEPYKGWTRWQFPTWLRLMSSSRGARNLRDGVARKIARHTHTSVREARNESLEPIRALMQNDPEFARAFGADVNLSAEELAFILQTKATTKKVKTLREEIEAELERRPREHATMWSDDPEVADDDEVGAAKAAVARAEKATDDAEAAPAEKPAKRAAKKVEKDIEEEVEKPTPKEGQKGLFEF